MKKRLAISLVLLVLFSTYIPQKLPIYKKFNIELIQLENNLILKDEDIKKNLNSLYSKNLIFFKTSDIEKNLKKNNFIESFKVKKIYPNKIKITIFEKKPIAILQNRKNKFYISENLNLIDYIYLENYKNLPIIFGNKENFVILYNNLKKINFPIELIKRYYSFESKRWDLDTYTKKTIKLPSKDYTESLKNFMNLRKERNFDTYTVFDYRISDQLILK